MENETLEQVVMQLIAYAGDARSLCYESVKYAREGDFKLANNLLKKAHEKLNQSQELHLKLLNLNKVDILVIHAQDHLNAATIELFMATEINYIYERLAKYEKGNL